MSKAAAAKHLSFAQVGSMYIQEFHKNPHVTGVRMIFVTLPDMDYRELDHLGTLSNQVFRALNRALADLKMDCKACEWKIVCDEVEGIKLLHQSLDHLGTLSNQVFRALNRALADLKMDCKACEWKIVCDEVEGIKLLHQSQIDKNQ